MAAIRSLENSKTLGQDSLELFEAEPEFAAQVLKPLFEAIWEEKQLPESWMENWKGVTLPSVPNKIIAKLIIRWISEAGGQQLRQEQAGFQKG